MSIEKTVTHCNAKVTPVMVNDESVKTEKSCVSAIRIGTKTKSVLCKIAETVNTNGGSKKIKPDAIIYYALKKINKQEIEELRATTFSNADLFEKEFMKHKRSNKNASKDEFLGMILHGKVKLLNCDISVV